MIEHVADSNAQLGIASTLVDLVRIRAAELGDKRAFQFVRGADFEAAILSYRDLHERAMSIASELRRHIAPGERALLVYPPGLEFIEAFFGCLFAGVIAVPVAPPGRKRFASSIMSVFTASAPALVLSTAEHRDQADESYAHMPQLLERPWIATDRLPTDQRHAWRDPRVEGRQIAFLQYTSGSTSSPKGVMLSHANLLYNAALIQSAFGGSTDDRAVFWLPLYHDMGLIGGVVEPIYYGGTCTLLAATAFLQRPALWLETISRTRATISGGPDFAYDLCARRIPAAERASLDLSSWRLAFTGAERIRAATLERFAEAFAPCGFRREAFFPCYGLAEATLFASGGPRGVAPTIIHIPAGALAQHQIRDAVPGDSAVLSLVGCGESLPGQRIVIVDPETCRSCREQEVGEIWVQGRSVASGYYERPEETAAVFGGYLADPNEGLPGRSPCALPLGQESTQDNISRPDDKAGPFLRTGDLGFLRDGQLFVTGRLKDLIIIRGRNYYPEDIEHTVDGAHRALRAGYCAAFSVDVDDHERLVIVQEVEPRQRGLDSEAAIQAIQRAVAARFEVEIHAIVLVKAGSIPKTSSGKTRRSACRDRYLDGQLETVALWRSNREDADDGGWDAPPDAVPRPATAREIEEWLLQRIAARLHLPPEQVRVTTPFLEFGMGSLEAVEIAAELERWLGRRLSPTAIYNHPNIASLAHWLATVSSAGDAAVATPRMSAEVLDPERLLNEVRQMTETDMADFVRQELAKQ